jgi:fatty-acyl-CoA synthase
MARALGLTDRNGAYFDSIDAVVARATRRAHLRSMPMPPFMHGAAHWNALSTWLSGGTVVVQDVVDRFDAIDALTVAAREDVTSAVIVGDAFGRPLVDALDAGAPVPTSLAHVISSGAILSRPVADALTARLPGVRVLDVLGSSEAGRQGRMARTTQSGGDGTFARDAGSTVISDDRARVLEPGDVEIGWLATEGRVPMGYLGDPDKTAATFPTIEGRRFVVPGDRARVTADGSIELHGRESVTINSGGEKIFAEEVERALKEHPAVDDVLVVGRPSARWGSEVVAVVAFRPGESATPDALGARAARHVARFKLPKDYVVTDRVPRSPSGKPDYEAARRLL